MQTPEIGVPTGIRTPVATVKGSCPRPLDDGDAAEKIGGARRDRTVDLLHAMQALSQLSYGPHFKAANCPEPGLYCQRQAVGPGRQGRLQAQLTSNS